MFSSWVFLKNRKEKKTNLFIDFTTASCFCEARPRNIDNSWRKAEKFFSELKATSCY